MTYLSLTYGTSRGRDTYGYTIVSLRDTDTGRRYRCSGGGYDMIGTVLASWLQDVHQADLMTIRERAGSSYSAGTRTENLTAGALYGMTYLADKHRVVLDGACGIRSVESIAQALGLTVRTDSSKHGRTLGFTVSSAEL